jgi:hypothetical protein
MIAAVPEPPHDHDVRHDHHAGPRRPDDTMILLYSLAAFLSAALLFLVQPMAARLVLPRLGGSPAVWNTSMLFFQAALLLGYLYAHVVGTRLRPKAQVLVHALVVGGAALMLPIALPASAAPPTGGSPIPWLLGTLALAVGAPFFVVATTGPLVQRWFSGTGHARAADPYFLYAASNAGSLLGLLGYPVLIEPLLSLHEQGVAWSAGYGAFAALSLTCGIVFATRSRCLHIAPAVPAGAPAAPAAPDQRPWRRRAWWTLLALLPSSHMLAVSLYLSTDLASAPLLWVVPLALYLLTFILAFSSRGPALGRWARRALPACLIALVVGILMEATKPIVALATLHLAVFFVAALACHARLADLRPAPARLTEFYLLIAVGGVLGGAFNALAAPILFDRVLEYPIVLVLIAFAAHTRSARSVRAPAPARPPVPPDSPTTSDPAAAGPGSSPTSSRASPADLAWDLALPILAGGLYVAGIEAAKVLHVESQQAIQAMSIAPAALVAFMCMLRPVRFALALAILLAMLPLGVQKTTSVLRSERTFFGVYRVTESERGGFHYLVHGSTTHGVQNTGDPARRNALAYYHRTGPIGQVFRYWVHGEERHAGTAGLPASAGGPPPPARREHADVAFIGLGTGALAAYGRPTDTFVFYEIDPGIAAIAKDPRYFTYLSDCAADWRIEFGDGRLSLANAPDASYDLIVLDAFSSDSIPIHLLTREAVEMYESKLKPGGVIAVHISNRYLDLEPVLTGIAKDLSLAMRAQDDTQVSTEEAAEGKYESNWVVLARQEADFGPLASDARWLRPAPNAREVHWTDDYSNILSVLDWK